MRDSRSEEQSDSSGAETNGLFNIDRRSIMRAAGGGATAAGLGSLGSAAFSSSAGAQAASDDNSFQIDVIEGDSNAIKSDPTSASNTYADDGDLIAYQWGNTATGSEGEGDGSRYLNYSGGGTVSSRPTFNIDFSNYTATVDVTVDSGSMDVTVVCYSAANGATTSSPGFDPAGPQSVVDSETVTGLGSSNTFTVDIPQVNNTNQAAGGYTSIQGAIDAASSGDSIEVEPATYDETVTVNTENLTLTSTGDKSNTDIRNTNTNADGMLVTANDVTVDGFNIIQDVSASGKSGLAVTGDRPTIQNCTIDINGGVSNALFYQSAGGTVDSVDINTDDNATVGINIDFGDSSTTIQNTTINDTSAVGIDATNGSGDVTIDNCTVTDSQGNMTNGIVIKDTITVQNTTVKNCSGSGILCDTAGAGASGSTITGCTISDTTGNMTNGIDIQETVTVNGGTSVSDGDTGIKIDDINTTIDTVTVNNTDVNAISALQGSTGTTVNNCTIANNNERGIYVDDEITIKNSDITDNGDGNTSATEDGIILGGNSQGSTIEKNEIRRNSNAGIRGQDVPDGFANTNANGTVVTDNNIVGNNFGCFAETSRGGTPTSSGASASDVLNIEGNWWGDDNGPDNQDTGTDSPGSGDTVGGDVDYDPWFGKAGGESGPISGIGAN
jgi:parallel beta-helix repeat protein